MSGAEPGLELRLAGPEDDPDLRRLLRDNPMPGSFTVAFAREPDYFHAGTIEGELHQTIVGRLGGGVVGIANRSAQEVFLDGEPGRVGYLSAVRIDSAYRGRGFLQEGFGWLKRLHDEGDVPFYVTTIIEGNERAVRALTSGKPPLPTYEPRGRLVTLALPTWPRPRRVALPGGVSIREAGTGDLEAVAACLQRNYARYQLAPRWTAAKLRDRERCRGLDARDFLIAVRDERVIGCLAVWDQQAFKQTVVHGYSGALKVLRPLLNLASRVAAVPHLPPPGSTLPHAYISHLAADEDDTEVLRALTAGALNRVIGRGYSYLMLALAEGHPYLPAARAAFRHFVYGATLFLVYWDDGAEAARALDGRTPHLEVAIL